MFLNCPTCLFINSSSVLNTEVANANLASRLDVIMIDLQQLSQFVRRRSNLMSGENNDGNNSRVMNNLEDCIRSAEDLLSSASTIVGSVVGGSVYGVKLTEEKRKGIDKWLKEGPMFQGDEFDDVSIPPESSGSLDDSFGAGDGVESAGMDAVTEELEQETQMSKDPCESREGDSEEITDGKDLVRKDPAKIGSRKLISEQSPASLTLMPVAESASISREGAP